MLLCLVLKCVFHGKHYQDGVNKEIGDDFGDHVSDLSDVDSEVVVQSLSHLADQEIVSFLLSLHDLLIGQLVQFFLLFFLFD